jgi:hypothetical protein
MGSGASLFESEEGFITKEQAIALMNGGEFNEKLFDASANEDGKVPASSWNEAVRQQQQAQNNNQHVEEQSELDATNTTPAIEPLTPLQPVESITPVSKSSSSSSSSGVVIVDPTIVRSPDSSIPLICKPKKVVRSTSALADIETRVNWLLSLDEAGVAKQVCCLKNICILYRHCTNLSP